MRYWSRRGRLLQRPLIQDLAIWHARVPFHPSLLPSPQVHADAPAAPCPGASAFFCLYIRADRLPCKDAGGRPSPRLPRLWIPARHSGFKRKDVYSKEYRHAQHKLPDFSTSIRISQVERLLKALFPAVFPPNRSLYFKKCQTATEIRNFVANSAFADVKLPTKEQGPATRPRCSSIPSLHSLKCVLETFKNAAVHLALCTFWKLLPPKRNANGLPRARPRCYDAVAVSGRGEIPHWR